MKLSEQANTRRKPWKVSLVLLAVSLISLANPAASRSQGVTPTSPQVKAMVDKGVAFLNSYQKQATTKSYKDHMGTIGGKALRGLAIAKYHDVYKIPGGKSNTHVAEALTTCRGAVESEKAMLGDVTGDYGQGNYDASIALIFLCEVDPDGSKAAIRKFTELLIKRQMPNGAWSYTQFQDRGFGDVSQTQYVILALWTAKQVGAYVPDDTFVNACNWLLRTQEGAGSWGYHPADGGRSPFRATDGQSTSNHNVAPSLAAAGLGSLYISAGILQFVNSTPVKESAKKKGVSSILKVKEEKQEFKGTKGVEKGPLFSGLQKGDNWFSGKGLSAKCGCNSGRFNCGGKEYFPFYYLYVYERYSTFRDLAHSRNESSPAWYQQGVQLLRRGQRKDGGWESGDKRLEVKHGRAVATSFAIFFLIRSTQKSVSKLAQETDFQGGRGLPADTTSARFEGAKVVGSPIGGDIDSLLGLLGDVNDPKFDNLVALPPELVLSKDQKKRNQQVVQLEKIIRTGNYEARRIAVQNLARSEGMDAVPILIFALSDPDETVMKAARDALCFVSRKIDGFKLKDKATVAQRAEAQEKWRNWYRSVRPDFKFD